jgi:hypothetical protein
MSGRPPGTFAVKACQGTKGQGLEALFLIVAPNLPYPALRIFILALYCLVEY